MVVQKMVNGIRTNYTMIYSKYIFKLSEFRNSEPETRNSELETCLPRDSFGRQAQRREEGSQYFIFYFVNFVIKQSSWRQS